MPRGQTKVLLQRGESAELHRLKCNYLVFGGTLAANRDYMVVVVNALQQPSSGPMLRASDPL